MQPNSQEEGCIFISVKQQIIQQDLLSYPGKRSTYFNRPPGTTSKKLPMPDIEDLMKALLSDETLRRKLSDSESPEKAVRVAKEAGYTISKNELLEAYKAKMATMSEEELTNVAGGKTVTSNQGGNQQNQSDGGGGEPQQQGGNVQINISS